MADEFGSVINSEFITELFSHKPQLVHYVPLTSLLMGIWAENGHQQIVILVMKSVTVNQVDIAGTLVLDGIDGPWFVRIHHVEVV